MTRDKRRLDAVALIEAARRGGASWDLIEASARSAHIPVRVVRAMKETDWESSTELARRVSESGSRLKKGGTKPKKSASVSAAPAAPSKRASKQTSKRTPGRKTAKNTSGRAPTARKRKGKPTSPDATIGSQQSGTTEPRQPVADWAAEVWERHIVEREAIAAERIANARDKRERLLAEQALAMARLHDDDLLLQRELQQVRIKRDEIKRGIRDIAIERGRTWRDSSDWMFRDIPIIGHTPNGFPIPDPDYMLDLADELGLDDVSSLYDDFYADVSDPDNA